jgi:ubiquinone/menaquinone biosynthesis C-methylase UbiE
VTTPSFSQAPARSTLWVDCRASPPGGDRSGPNAAFDVRSDRATPLQALAVARERRVWNRRADNWDDAGSAGLTQVVEAVIREGRSVLNAVAIDLGAGSGAVTVPLASSCRRILAVDVSDGLLGHLADKAQARGVANIETLNHAIETLDLAPDSVDLIVSNYALHHLRDADKARVLERSYRWLRPGGRLVIGDMMFGRAVNAETRRIVASKSAVFLRRGPAGWFRLVKNLLRFALRAGEKPLPPPAWEALARGAGFEEVAVTRVVAEAHVLVAVKAGTSAP